MKRLSIIICYLLFSITLLTSCLDSKDPYRAGFLFYKPTSSVISVYANNVVDSIIIYSYGNWNLSNTEGQSNWWSLDRTQGKAGVAYSIPLRFQQNTSDNERSVKLTFADTDHPGDAYANLLYSQYATRGDGSLGSAADVKTITGSDGSRFVFTYDALHRPTSLFVSKDDHTLYNMRLRFNDDDSTLTVITNSRELRAAYGNDYQPMLLVGTTDTIGYYAQYYFESYIQMPASHAFNIEHHQYGQPTKRYAFRLGGQSLKPDSLHNADSLRIGSDYVVENLKLIYSKTDNRRQSVDANQLIFGTEECDPYQLLSLFRYSRSTNVISEAIGKNADERITVSTTLNADRSISSLTVTRRENQIVYTFEY